MCPRGLLKRGESLQIQVRGCGRLTIYRFDGQKRVELLKILVDGEGQALPPWTASQAGRYLVVFQPETGGEPFQRPLAVVEPGWAVCQVTVGSFTAEDFAETLHPAGLPVDYYITVSEPRDSNCAGGQATEPRWREYERRFGDAIHPHVMAADLGGIDPALAHNNANWDTLTVAEIERRLKGLQQWWSGQGYEPLDRVATYTPCNKFVQACRKTGIRLIHSLVPEQNWSDGEWGINDWGMPNCPFWIAGDDYRKPTARTDDAVLGMSMDHYAVLIPHLTKWGDHVLSPSHFLRWIRTTDTGPEPVRFEQFLRDTLRGWKSFSDEPFFFVAGFEFGRTFGTAKMTDYNRRGIERLISLAADERVVFATSRDVRAYYDRHQPQHPESVFVQRDYWAGTDVSSKPLMAGDSAIIERRDYKALVREGELLPMFHYDYLEQWSFPAACEDAPHDYAAQTRQELQARIAGDTLILQAEKPLTRTVPVVVWDTTVQDTTVAATALPILDNGRRHTLIEVHAGWQGVRTVPIERRVAAQPTRPTWWKTQSFGTDNRRHTYLSFDLPLLRDVTIPVALRKPAFVEATQAPIGRYSAGTVELTFGPLRTWHRFWGVEPEDVMPTEQTFAAVAALKPGEDRLAEGWPEEVQQHNQRLREAMLARTGCGPQDVALEVFCGARQPIRGQCRAAAYDIVHAASPELTAHEHGDGVIAFGPGKSFWYHPRGLPFEIRGLESLRHHRRLRLLLNSFDPLHQDARYTVTLGSPYADGGSGGAPLRWQLPASAFHNEAWLDIELEGEQIPLNGRLMITLRTDQQQILYDWWAERGFVAALHALWVITARG